MSPSQWFLEMETAILPFIFTAFLAGLSATLPPGPIFAMTVTETTRRGFVGGFMVVVGHAMVEVLVLIALTLGLGVFLTSSPVRISVSVLGGFLLIWMGQNLVRGAYKEAISIRGKAPTKVNVAYDPLVLGVLNPKSIIARALNFLKLRSTNETKKGGFLRLLGVGLD